MIPAALSQVTKVAEHKEELTKLKKACDGMESSFLRQLLHTMRESVTETDLGGDKTGMDTYRDMLDGAMADKMAQRGTLGISKMAYEAMAGRILKGKEAR